MIRKIVFLLYIFCIFSPQFNVFAQSSPLYIPRTIEKTYTSGTRTKTGMPGNAYWQNSSDYTIKATLDPVTGILDGKENIVYTNNSPDTLRQLVIRLYPDIFKKGTARDEFVDPADVTDGVDIKKLQVNGSAITVKAAQSIARRSGTNLFLQLTESLLPGNKINLSLNWTYTVPRKTHIREGVYGESSFFIAYWYPQIAVYDDVDGWDTYNYTGTQEFYNDFSNFDVEITMPDEYLVWATGTLQNPEQLLEKEYASRYASAKTSDEILKIVTQADRKKGNITPGKNRQTWKFKAGNVPDFAFATSNTYIWDATSVVVDEKNGRRTLIQALYNPAAKDFYEVARYGRESVKYFSTELPGVPFPYPHISVFNGSGGMEFPMMVNDGSFNLSGAAEVTAHEIAHTYFPFYMGINERKYAWMDEGWAQMLPNEMKLALRPGDSKSFSPQTYNAQILSNFAGHELDMPLMVPSVLLRGTSYGYASYYKPAVAYALLKDMLGNDVFTKTLQEYMNRWHGKHPIPYDFFYTFNDVLQQELNWFWKPWFFEMGYPDLAIKDVRLEDKKVKISIERIGNLPLPVHLTVTFTDNTKEIIKEPMKSWSTGAKEIILEREFVKAVKKVELGSNLVPDVKPENNIWSFRKN